MYRAVRKVRSIKSSAALCSRLLGSNGLQSADGDSKNAKYLKSDDQLTYDDRPQIQEVGLRSTKPNTFEKRREIFSNLNKELRNDYKIKQMDKYYNDELVQSLEHCDSMAGLLKNIESQTSRLRTDHLEVIYEKIGMLCKEAKRKMSAQEYEQLKEAVRSSHIYVSLLIRTMQLIRELDNSCLVKQLVAFRLLDQDPGSKIMAITCQMLKHKVNGLQLEEIQDCLKVLSSYSIGTSLDAFFNAFYPALLLVASSKITSNAYDYEDVDLVIYFFVVLTRTGNFEFCYDAALRLVQVLLLKENQLDSRQAARLLQQIERIRFPTSFPSDDARLFEQLVSKCVIAKRKEICE